MEDERGPGAAPGKAGTAPGEGRLPLSTKLAYGSGSVAEGVKDAAFKTFLLFYYNQVLGLPGWMGGAAGAVALLVDAAIDPFIGSLSDATRTRWGRRHPWMYAAALPMALGFRLLFDPPSGLSNAQLFLWLAFFSVVVRCSMSLYSIPSNSMVAELTPNYDERTSLLAFRYLFGWTGAVTVTLLAYLWLMAPGAKLADGLRNPAGYAPWSAVGACMIGGAILASALGTHRLIPGLKAPPAHEPFSLARLRGEIGEALGNPSYRTLVVASIFASVAGAFNDVFGLYLNTYFWEFRPEQLAAFVPALVVGVTIGVGVARPISVRFDKRHAALALATAAILVGPLPIFLRLAGLMPANGSARLLWILVAHVAFMVACAVSVGILIGSMISDTIDQNELLHGSRREGIFSSAIAFSAKAATGIGTFLAGAALDLVHFPRPSPGEAPPPIAPGQADALGWIVGPGLFGLWLVTLVFLSRYRLSRQEHARILAELARRPSAA
ncbi:MFS transporter [bacterium]|nr:MFS transporter [bacterium]